MRADPRLDVRSLTRQLRRATGTPIRVRLRSLAGAWLDADERRRLGGARRGTTRIVELHAASRALVVARTATRDAGAARRALGRLGRRSLATLLFDRRIARPVDRRPRPLSPARGGWAAAPPWPARRRSWRLCGDVLVVTEWFAPEVLAALTARR
jgi:chorismate-pyruvate lyase